MRRVWVIVKSMINIYIHKSLAVISILACLALLGCLPSAEVKDLASTENAITIVETKDDKIAKYLSDAEIALENCNYDAVIDSYKKAVRLGSLLAKFRLGLAYYDGLIIARDRTKGWRYIRYAAEMGCDEAVAFVSEKRSRVAKLLDANELVKEIYGVSLGMAVCEKDAMALGVNPNVFNKSVAEGRWITILLPHFPKGSNVKIIHIHLDVNDFFIDGIRAYVPAQVNGKDKAALALASGNLLAPFERIAGREGNYYEEDEALVTKGIEMSDSLAENWLRVTYATREFGAHLELRSRGTCFAEYSSEIIGEFNEL